MLNRKGFVSGLAAGLGLAILVSFGVSARAQTAPTTSTTIIVPAKVTRKRTVTRRTTRTPRTVVSHPLSTASGVATVTKRKTTASTKTVAATLVRRDPTTLLLHLDKTDKTLGSDVTATYDIDTRFIQNNVPVQADGFAPNERVVARLGLRGMGTTGTTTTPQARVRTLWDAASYAKSQRDRKDICVGTVVQFTGENVTIRTTANETRTFGVTDKTLLIKGGRAAGVADYPAGATVAIKPRGLPGGSIMASILGESAQAVAWAYRDGLISWDGTVAGVEVAANTLLLHRSDEADRRVQLLPNTPIKDGRLIVTLDSLKPGTPVRLHMVKSETRLPSVYTADKVSVGAVKRRTTTGTAP